MSDKKFKKTRESSKKRHHHKRGSHRNKEIKQSKKRLTIVSQVMDVLFFIIILVILGGSFLFMISQKEDKTIAGYRFYDVLTNSMVKTKSGQKGNFNSGDMIIVKSIKPKEVKVGDIITFVPNTDSENTFLTHRVIKKNESKEGDQNNGEEKSNKTGVSFVTQGDANNSPDPEISGENVIGKKVLVIPKAGTVIKFVRENLMLTLIFIVSLCLIVFLIKGYFEETSKKKKGRTKKKSRREKNEKIKKK